MTQHHYVNEYNLDLNLSWQGQGQGLDILVVYHHDTRGKADHFTVIQHHPILTLFSMSSLHFVLIPFMAPGHIIPMIDMAKVLAKRGIRISIIVTPINNQRFSSVIARAVASGLTIQFNQVRFPCQEAGLPIGCESIDDLPSFALLRNFLSAVVLLQNPIERLLKEMNPHPSCIICDKHIPWISQTCNKFEIPGILFDGMSCFTRLVEHNIYVSRIHETVPPDEPFVVPGLPDKVEFTIFQLPSFFNQGPVDFHEIRQQIRENESKAYGMVVNSFEELEKGYADGFRKLKQGKVWCIGPSSLCSDDGLDRAERGNQASIDTDSCLKWLDRRNPGSVIYVCLGSLGRVSPGQFAELASGLESSGYPFILVVKGGETTCEIEKWIVANGIEERTKERGLFIRGWAPQVLILSHSAIGCFLTHCGWNSTLEGICAGLPMVTWPLFGDQFLNEKLLVQILQIGVRVGATRVVHLYAVEKCVPYVMREEIHEAIEAVMDKGDEGCERRKRAQELGVVAKKSVQEGGSSQHNVTLLIQDIQQFLKNQHQHQHQQ